LKKNKIEIFHVLARFANLSLIKNARFANFPFIFKFYFLAFLIKN
jgi:hypothetical protein